MKKQKEIFDAISLECSKITTKRYSTSFSLAIKLLGKEYQNAIYSIYGFVVFPNTLNTNYISW